jgi:hypothetical protein
MRRYVLHLIIIVKLLIQNLGGKGPLMQHEIFHLFVILVLPLSYLVLFWSLWNCML